MTLRLVKLETAPDLVDRVYRALVDAISTGELAPGERVTQEDVAERLAVSRQPVLQAIRQLKNDGLLLEMPGRGVAVAPLDGTWIRNVYQVRSTLDALAARLAAEHRHQIDQRLLDQGRKAVKSRDVAAMIDADVAFHTAIYAGSGNPLIEQSARLYWAHLRRAMGIVLQATGVRDQVWNEHEAIADAIAAGAADKAAKLITAHGRRAGDNIAQQLAVSDSPPPRSPVSRRKPPLRRRS